VTYTTIYVLTTFSKRAHNMALYHNKSDATIGSDCSLRESLYNHGFVFNQSDVTIDLYNLCCQNETT